MKLNNTCDLLIVSCLPDPPTWLSSSYHSVMFTQDAAHGLPIETKPVVDTLASIVLGDKGVLDRLISVENSEGGVTTIESRS